VVAVAIDPSNSHNSRNSRRPLNASILWTVACRCHNDNVVSQRIFNDLL
jgi:hypothetical protein